MQNGRLPPISDEPYESSPREVLITISSHSIEAPSTKDTVLLRLRTADRLHIRRIAIPIAVFVVAALLVTFLVAGKNQSASFSADFASPYATVINSNYVLVHIKVTNSGGRLGSPNCSARIASLHFNGDVVFLDDSQDATGQKILREVKPKHTAAFQGVLRVKNTSKPDQRLFLTGVSLRCMPYP
jgi:hypothetical protein